MSSTNAPLLPLDGLDKALEPKGQLVDASPTITARADGGSRTTARKGEILAVAADLFAAKGYGATAMSDLAAALGIQKASLYHHVRKKETLLYELSLNSMSRIIGAAAAVPDSAPVARLRALIESHVATLLTDQTTHATALIELRCLSPQDRGHIVELRDGYDRIMEEAIRAAQTAAGLWPNVSPKVVRLALLGMLNWSVFWYRPEGDLTGAEIAKGFASIFFGESASTAIE